MRIPRRRRSRSDDGYVTAETAIVLPALVVLLGVALWAIAVAGAQVRCVDAARDAARAAARGEPDAAVVAVATAAGPPGCDVVVSHRGDRVVVIVRARIGPASGPLSAIAAPVAQATAVAETEPG
ncbi:MAG TPA: TadE family type IV pilus minor pilin [Acidothermaceae bacterium]|nr:TadE family type IV pilus minor pilin [Acidothermaceae bacterium]